MNHTRRSFIQTGLAAATIGPAFSNSSSRPGHRLRIAGIGVGGMGFSNLTNLANEDIVALCDVDHQVAERSFKKFPKAKRWTDFREMLEKQDEIEAVLIATPDHTHASIALAALKAGKHVYCQKPMTHDIFESRRLAEAALDAKNSVAVMGNQHHSSRGARKVVDWVRAGLIGDVKRVIAWCGLNYRPFGHAFWSTLVNSPPSEHPPVPPTLDWDLWLGHAGQRPYHPTYHPGRWRAWWDFGCGMMGDRGVHTLDATCWALDLAAPTLIERHLIEGENEFVHPDKAHIRYHFPSRDSFVPLQLDWYSGIRPVEVDELTGDHKAGDDEGGAVIIGSEGIICHGTYPGNSLTLLPAGLRKEAATIKSELPELRGSHESIWAAACKGEGPVSSGFAYAAGLNELTHLGNLAIRLGGKVEWDAAKGVSLNRPEAAGLIRMPRRDGWGLE